MEEGKPSRTADRVAIERAAHQLLDSPKLLDDPLALRVLDPAAREELLADPRSHDHSPLSRPLRSLVVVRSRIAEDEIARRVSEGVDQYVVLGAGLDTFAYRQHFASLKVFEVDQPWTQQLKKERLAAAGIAAPSSLTYVPCDFRTQSLAGALAAGGFDAQRPAVFAWLGVSMYLERRDVDATLSYVASLPPRTSIVFDYAQPVESFSMVRRMLYRAMLERLERAGEPWQSFFDPVALRDHLLALGFTSVENLGPDEINSTYLANRTDGLEARGLGHIAIARR